MAKRGVDIALGLVLLVCSLPVLVLAVLASAVALGSWPFFVQDRVGQHGRRFRFVKVRTLPPSTPAYASKHDIDVTRVPWICQRLRQLHVDELPQLLLVVTGKMTLVGPRPEMPGLHAGLEHAVAEERVSVRPGCTGLWQVGQHCTGLIGEAPQYDQFYLRHKSLRLDLWIILRTLAKMLSIGQPVTLESIPGWAVAGQPAHAGVPGLVGGPQS